MCFYHILSQSVNEHHHHPVRYYFTVSFLFQISNCSLKRLDNRILNLKQLSHLDLSNNKLTIVPPSLRELACLSALVLSNNVITEFSDDMCVINSKICSSLRTLDLSGKFDFSGLLAFFYFLFTTLFI